MALRSRARTGASRRKRLMLNGKSGLPFNSLANVDPPSTVTDPSPFETWRTRPLDGTISFQSRNSWAAMQACPTVRAGDVFNWSISPFPDLSSITNAQIAAGTYDTQITAIANAMVAAGWNSRKIMLRLAWECNGDWFQWAHGYAAPYGGVANYIAMWQRYVNLFRAAGMTEALWDWNMNKGGVATVWTTAYPGDAYVDIISIDPYDQYLPVTTDAGWTTEITSRNPGLNEVVTFAAAHGKQVGIPEWALKHDTVPDGGGGDNPFYIAKMWQWVNANKSILAYESYYDTSGGTQQHWISTGANPLGAAQYRAVYPDGWATVDTSTPIPTGNVYVQETFTGTNGATPGHLILGVTPTGGSVTIQNNQADFATGTAGAYAGSVNRVISQNGTAALSISDVDVTVSVTYGTGEAYAQLVARTNQTAWNGDTGYFLDFSDVFRIGKWVGYTQTILATGTPFTFTPGTQYKVRFRVVGTSLQGFVGTTLPATPTISATDSTIAGGNVVLHVGGGNATTSTHVLFDDLLVSDGSAGASPPIALVAGTPFQSTASVTSGTVTLPTGLVAGDYTFLFCTLNGTTGTITAPSGWSTAFASARSTASTAHAMAIYYKLWASGDANPVVTSTSGRLAVLPVRVRNASTTALFEGTVGSTTQAAATTSVDAPSQTASTSKLLVTAHAGRSATNNVFITWTAPSGMTEVGEAGSQATTNTTNTSIEVNSLVVAAGATGAKTATASLTATGSRGVSFLLNQKP